MCTDGAWFLHKHTVEKDKELRAFVLYSSVSALFGNPGQANYSAANAYLDELVRWRVAQGLPGVSVQWPAVSGVGMAAAMAKGARISEKLSVGVGTVKAVLQQVVCGLVLLEPVQAVVPRGMLEAGSFPPPIASLVENVQVAAANTRPQKAKSERAAATSQGSRWHGVGLAEARQQILTEVTSAVSELLGEEHKQHGELDTSAPLMDMGLDSLAATQLMRGLNESLEVEISPTLLFDYPTINALSDHLAGLVSNDTVSQDIASNVPQQLTEHATGPPQDQSVAIVGMSCRFPGGMEGPDMFWDAIQAGRCMVSKVPFCRWDVDAVAARVASLDKRVKGCMTWGGFVENLELFDASFFRISAAEASAMDPQQRLLLEYSYLAFHDAGYTKEALQGRDAGVFVGIAGNDAQEVAGSRSGADISVYSANGTTHSTAAGRLSFVFGLQGPCAAYDTACSSALVALHSAVRNLQYGDCDVAVAVGVNAMLTPTVSVSFAIAGMTSPTGRCHTFDEDADGYCRGEGCGAVVLKRMRDAVSDQDRVHAIVLGIGVAQDGTSASLTAPNGRAQEKLLRATLQDAGLASHEVDYLEAHGTGTALGDPIEMNALKAVMSENRSDERPLIMGGVKANIGHLEAAAGMTGFPSSFYCYRTLTLVYCYMSSLCLTMNASRPSDDCFFPSTDTNPDTGVQGWSRRCWCCGTSRRHRTRS